MTIDPLADAEVTGWFAQAPEFLLTIDGQGIPFQVSDADLWRGWEIELRYRPDAASAGWLERSVMANEIAIATPSESFFLPRDEESRRQYAEFVKACEEERFGRHSTEPELGTIALPPRPENVERAVIYEEPHRSLETTTVAATVTWRFENGTAAPVIVADMNAPDRGLSAQLTISASAAGSRFDFVVRDGCSRRLPRRRIR